MAFEAIPEQNNLGSTIRSALADIDEQLHGNGLVLNILSPKSKLESFEKYGVGDSHVVNAYDYLWTARNKVKEIQALTEGAKTLMELPTELFEYLQTLIIQLQDQGGYEATLAPKIREWLDKYSNNTTEENTNELWSIVRGFHRSLLLSGFVDVRINDKSETGKVIGQEGLDFEKGLSGMTIPIYSIEEPDKPIAVMNLILNNFETYKSTRFVQQSVSGEEVGIRVVGPEAFMGEPYPDNVLTIGWLNIRPDFRGRVTLVRSINRIYHTILKSINNSANQLGKKVIVMLERDGTELNSTPDADVLPKNKFIERGDPHLKAERENGQITSAQTILGKGSNTSKAVPVIAQQLGLEKVENIGHTVPDPYGEVFKGDLQTAIANIEAMEIATAERRLKRPEQ